MFFLILIREQKKMSIILYGPQMNLESQGIPWHGVRMVWKILRSYSRAGRLSENFSQEKESIRSEIENALGKELFWQTYLSLIEDLPEENVKVDDIRTLLLEKMTLLEFESVLEKEKSFSHIFYDSAEQTLRANFDQLAREAVDGIGLPVSYEMPGASLGYPPPSPRKKSIIVWPTIPSFSKATVYAPAFSTKRTAFVSKYSQGKKSPLRYPAKRKISLSNGQRI